jgi:Rhodopirellula transposase DDE domain
MNREVHVRFWERAGVKFPRATRQHRMFCHITQTWRGKPLISREAVVELIASTTTRTGLTVRCELDTRSYPKGIKVSDAEMATLNLTGDAFHPEWNYTVSPRSSA